MLKTTSTSFGLANTNTFRRASKKLFGKYGGNLQNPSPNISRIFVPKPGNIFLQPDQAGAEALVVAYLAPHGKFRDLFLNGIKSHTYVASHIFKHKWLTDGFLTTPTLNTLPIKELPSNSEWTRLASVIKKSKYEYFIGKKSCHSFNYRMAPSTFQEDVLKESDGEVALSKLESLAFHTTYHTVFPEISQGWWPELEFQIIKTGYLYNLFGFPLFCDYYEGMMNKDKFWRESTAKVPQSTVGCITAIAFCKVQEYIEANGLSGIWHLRNDKHDSLLLECPENNRDDAAPILQQAIEQELVSPRGEHFKMKSEIGWGYNWMKHDEKQNPEGMRELKI